MTEGARQEIVRDQFIEGLHDEHIQERLLQEAPETMDNALKLAKQLGTARAEQRSLKSSQPAATTVSSVSERIDLEQLSSQEEHSGSPQGISANASNKTEP